MSDYIYFNNTEALPRPVNFSPDREDVYAGEITTCTGKLIADRIGWKYADITLEWSALPQSDVEKLISITDVVPFTFEDVDGEHTENVIRKKAVSMKNRNTINGVVYWRNVSIELVFIDVHNS